MKRGTPPTARKARTGEFTPPGMLRWARLKSSSERSMTQAFPDVGRAAPAMSRGGKAQPARPACGSAGLSVKFPEQARIAPRRGLHRRRRAVAEHAFDRSDQVGAVGDQRRRVVRRDAADGAERHAELAACAAQ